LRDDKAMVHIQTSNLKLPSTAIFASACAFIYGGKLNKKVVDGLRLAEDVMELEAPIIPVPHSRAVHSSW